MGAVRVFVTGRVQGVWFRASTQQEALRHGLRGFVRNLRDGRVEARFEGPEDAVASMVAWCGRGPELAVVTHVEVEEVTPEGNYAGFEVVATA